MHRKAPPFFSEMIGPLDPQLSSDRKRVGFLLGSAAANHFELKAEENTMQQDEIQHHRECARQNVRELAWHQAVGDRTRSVCPRPAPDFKDTDLNQVWRETYLSAFHAQVHEEDLAVVHDTAQVEGRAGLAEDEPEIFSCEYCKRLKNLILTGHLRCPRCGQPDNATAAKLWKSSHIL
jgi:hypothetical protein